MLAAKDYRRVLGVLRACADAVDSDEFRTVVLEAVNRHLGYDHLTFFLGRHPAAHLSLREPTAVGIPNELLERYLTRHARNDVFASVHARGLLRMQGMACLPQVLDAKLTPAQSNYASGFLGANGISDKAMVWLDTELPVHGFLGVLAVGGNRLDDHDHAVLDELRPHLTFLLRTHLRRASGVDTSPLTVREHQVARLVADGWSNAAIARHFEIGEWTVKKHVSRVLAKCDVQSRTELAVLWRGGDGQHVEVQSVSGS